MLFTNPLLFDKSEFLLFEVDELFDKLEYCKFLIFLFRGSLYILSREQVTS